MRSDSRTKSFTICSHRGTETKTTTEDTMRQHVAHTIDRELFHTKPIWDADWDHNMCVLEGSREFGDPPTIERGRAALSIADALVGKLVKATDEELRMSVYIALTLSPYKVRSRYGVNSDEAVGEAARAIVAKLREDGWRIMRNPPSYRGHGHTGHTLRTEPLARCKNCD